MHGHQGKSRVVVSTLAAETLPLEQAQEACFIIKSYIFEIMNGQVSEKFLPLKCYIDNKSLIDSIHSIKTVTEKMMQIDLCKEVTLVDWYESELQFTDCLTKGTENCMKF